MSPELINLFTQSDAYSVCQDILCENDVIIKDKRSQIALGYPENPEYDPL